MCLMLLLCCVYQRPVTQVLSGSLLRFDKLDQSEVKNMLMCFLHVLKNMSEGTHTHTHHSVDRASGHAKVMGSSPGVAETNV